MLKTAALQWGLGEGQVPGPALSFAAVSCELSVGDGLVALRASCSQVLKTAALQWDWERDRFPGPALSLQR